MTHRTNIAAQLLPVGIAVSVAVLPSHAMSMWSAPVDAQAASELETLDAVSEAIIALDDELERTVRARRAAGERVQPAIDSVRDQLHALAARAAQLAHHQPGTEVARRAWVARRVASALISMGELYLAEREIERGIAEAGEEGPGLFVDLRAVLAYQQGIAGRHASAQHNFDKAREAIVDDDGSRAVIDLAEAWVSASGSPVAAIEDFADRAELLADPDTATLMHMLLVMYATGRGDEDGYARHSEAMLASAPGATDVMLRTIPPVLGRVLHRPSAPPTPADRDAVRALQEATAADERQGMLRLATFGLLASQFGDPDLAIELLDEAVRQAERLPQGDERRRVVAQARVIGERRVSGEVDPLAPAELDAVIGFDISGSGSGGLSLRLRLGLWWQGEPYPYHQSFVEPLPVM